MEGDVMRMRALSSLELPAGQAVQLKPGGFHVMLMDLKAPLKADTQVPLTLRFQDARGAVSTLQVSVPVAVRAPAGAAAAAHPHRH
jgi:copper(I)-binding protein